MKMEFRLEEIFDLQMGKTPSRNNPDYWNSEDNKWISIADLSKCGKYIENTKEYLSDLAVEESGISCIPENTVVMSFKLSIGKTAITPEPMFSNEAIMSFRDKKIVEILPDYIYYMFSGKDWDEGTNKAVMGKTLNKATLSKIKVNIPDVEEQRSAVEVLDKVSKLIANRKAELEKLDELIKARFVEMFGEAETNVKGFPMKRMDECCKYIGGAQPDKSHFEYEKTDDNIRLIQIRDYKSDRFITYIPKTLARKTCTSSDIMIGRYGPPIFQILGGIEGAYNVALMKAVPTVEFNTEYFRYFLKSEKLLHYLESFSQRTAGQDGIQIDKLNAYPCFVPPMELQIQFAAFVEQTDKSKLNKIAARWPAKAVVQLFFSIIK